MQHNSGKGKRAVGRARQERRTMILYQPSEKRGAKRCRSGTLASGGKGKGLHFGKWERKAGKWIKRTNRWKKKSNGWRKALREKKESGTIWKKKKRRVHHQIIAVEGGGGKDSHGGKAFVIPFLTGGAKGTLCGLISVDSKGEGTTTFLPAREGGSDSSKVKRFRIF